MRKESGNDTRDEQAFSFVLGKLVEGREWSAAQLAQRLHRHPSLVQKWLRGTRVPELHSSHVERIAQVLDLSPAERERLITAHVYSVEREMRRQRRGDLAASSLLQRKEERQPLPELPDRFRQPPPHQPRALRGERQIVEFGIRMLLAAAETLPSASVYTTLNGSQRASDSDPELNTWWRLAVRELLLHGWMLCQLLRIDHTVERLLSQIENVQWFLGAGSERGSEYQAYYLTDYRTVEVPHGFVVVPGIGALVLLATQNAARVDAGLYLPHTAQTDEQIKLLVEHVQQFLRTPGLAEPIFTSFPLDEEGSEDFWDEEVKVEQPPGGRYLIKGRLSMLTRPPEYYTQGAHYLEGGSPERRARAVERYQRRREAFERNVRTELYRDMCPLRAVKHLVDDGLYNPPHDTWPADPETHHKTVPLTEPERLAHLRRLVDMLRMYDNYELALLDDAEAHILVRTDWEVLPGAPAVLLETWSPPETGSDSLRGAERAIMLQIIEPTLVHAFYSHAERLWGQILPLHRDKTWVIGRLEEYIRTLQRKCEAAGR